MHPSTICMIKAAIVREREEIEATKRLREYSQIAERELVKRFAQAQHDLIMKQHLLASYDADLKRHEKRLAELTEDLQVGTLPPPEPSY